MWRWQGAHSTPAGDRLAGLPLRSTGCCQWDKQPAWAASVRPAALPGKPANQIAIPFTWNGLLKSGSANGLLSKSDIFQVCVPPCLFCFSGVLYLLIFFFFLKKGYPPSMNVTVRRLTLGFLQQQNGRNGSDVRDQSDTPPHRDVTLTATTGTFICLKCAHFSLLPRAP